MEKTKEENKQEIEAEIQRINPDAIRCPHCQHLLDIAALNCGIFRHGFLPPHAPKEQCERAVQDGSIIDGCGKPFRVERIEGRLVASICEYI